MKDSLKLYQKEADLTEKVRGWLNSQADIKAVKICDRYKKGIPDFLACVSGRYVGIELKAEKGTESPHQKQFIRQIKRAGGVGGTCYCLDDVIKLVEEARRA